MFLGFLIITIHYTVAKHPILIFEAAIFRP